MIIDSHCHAWTYWPYEPPVPDPTSRGNIEQLLFEMDQNGVDRAVVVCARIDHNPDNNDYIAEQVARLPHRLVMFADVDCSWWPTYHTPGAADRLAEAADRYNLKGFTHYLGDDDGSWLYSDEGLAFFEVAAQRGLIASISCRPQHQAAIRKVAERFPSMPILIHHMGLIGPDDAPPHPGLREVMASARYPNIYLKLSGFVYHTPASASWNFPYSNTHWIVRTLYQEFGPYRMCWGSDFPVVGQWMTYRQSLEAFRTHCAFVTEEDRAWILGKTLARLLDDE